MNTKNKNIYLDYSATTPVKEEVLNEMLPYFTENFGNPSSLYEIGENSKNAISVARKQVADIIGAEASEIFFTGSGTEADNWALISVAEKLKEKGNHIITTNIEHHAIFHTCNFLSKQGFNITMLPVDKEGLVSAEELKAAITEKTILVSIMLVNNEIGTIQPIKELCSITKNASGELKENNSISHDI
ncbi:MAG: cysteine desulfurase family protein, partial [Anaerovoracaceae bacterium]